MHLRLSSLKDERAARSAQSIRLPLIRVLKALTSAALTASGVVLLVFLALRFAPGDPVDLILGENAIAADRQALREQLGLHLPVLTQLKNYLLALADFDLGTSLTQRVAVTELIGGRIMNSLLLAAVACFFANILGISLGVIAAQRSSSNRALPQLILVLSALMIAVPSFWLGPILVLAFSFNFPWLPVSAFESWTGLILPALTLSLILAASLIQTTRAAVSECLSSDYIRTARAKGAGELRALFTHALPNAAVPIVTVSLLQLSQLLSGAVIVETIFDWPGLGTLTYEAILQRDYPTVQGTVLLAALSYVALSMLADVLNSKVTKQEGKGA